MKAILTVSLLFNCILAFLFYQEKQRPPLERIIIEKEVEVSKNLSRKKLFNEAQAEAHGQSPRLVKKSETSSEVKTKDDEFVPAPVIFDENDIPPAIEEVKNIKKQFLEHELSLSEKTIQEAEKIRQEYEQKSSSIYQKHPLSMTMSFAEKRELIRLEEKKESHLKKLYGEEKWKKYKSFVDRYNQNVLKRHQDGEMQVILMPY